MSDLARVNAAMRATLTRVARDVMLNLHGHLVEDTPKDTGFAAVNWIPSVGAPNEGLAGTREAAEQGRLEREPQRAGESALAAYDLSQGDLYDVNNVHYIETLNRGSSKQAPAAFVQAAISKGIRDTGGRG